MNKLKKYFQFSGTINGTNYFLRQLLAAITAFIGGTLIGVGIGQVLSILLILGIIVAGGAIWFSLVTMYKRFSSLHPQQASVLTVSLFSLQTLSTMFDQTNSFGLVLKLLLVFIGLYLIFVNSNLKNHEG
jgi:Ca2+/Na+ antiporter